LVHLPPRELSALRLLIAHAGQVVSPAQMKNALWGDVHVTADSVPKCMSSLRARLEPDECIQTVYKRGYRFTATIRREGAAPAGTFVRLAIMPFATGHSVPEHLGMALAEETTACLSRADGFAVAVLARDSVFNLAQRGLTALQIGRELKADLVLTGTLQAFSSHYRLRAEMIHVEDGTQIWVEDLLTPQNRAGVLEQELMQRLAYRLGAGVPAEAALSQRRSDAGIDISAAAVNGIQNESGLRQAEAYEMFLSGHHEWQTLHRHRMQDGLQRLLKAIELDPTLTCAKVDLANLCVVQALYGFMSPAVAAELVHRMADSIPDLPFQAEALLPSLGWINFHSTATCLRPCWLTLSARTCPTSSVPPAHALYLLLAAIALPRPSSCCVTPFASIPFRPGSTTAWHGRSTWMGRPPKAWSISARRSLCSQAMMLPASMGR
jgi:TolB-like protein